MHAKRQSGVYRGTILDQCFAVYTWGLKGGGEQRITSDWRLAYTFRTLTHPINLDNFCDKMFNRTQSTLSPVIGIWITIGNVKFGKNLHENEKKIEEE